MDNIIHLLPDYVANQIAAGEVVQRPSSVIKELLENSIDAKASQIEVVVKEAGRKLIFVSDNGIGMSMVDARMSFERHATSKIKTTQDIFSISTNGFRGEALASIAAVSQVELKTKKETDQLGTALQIEGNEIKKQEPAVINKAGSIFSVKNLFYNVPARRNFLKSNQVELRYIIDEFLRVAIPNSNTQFSLTHNETLLFSLKNKNLKQRLVEIFGDKINEHLIPIKETTDLVEIDGFVCKPERAKKNNKEKFIFVNNRFIKSAYLNKAINDAFEGLISSESSPSFFLFIKILPSKVDINIHPTKTEIKFEDEVAIFSIIKACIRHSLGLYNLTPSLDFEQNPDLAFISNNIPNKYFSQPNITVNSNFNPFKKNQFNSANQQNLAHQSIWIEENYKEEEQPQINFVETKENQNAFTNYFQLNNSYLVVEKKDDLYIIDQHRAHQKILFDSLMKNYLNHNNVSKKILLFPVEIILNTDELAHFILIEDMLTLIGFDISVFNKTIIINATPSILSKENLDVLFQDIFAIQEKTDILKNMLKLIVKAAAIKKNIPLQKEEINNLLVDLFSLNEFNYSPFGKPICVNLSLEKIKKSFS
ncbi:MAG: DNA mismatch repair endonuclease MutL [Solirubrobacteraceae bacterium]